MILVKNGNVFTLENEGSKKLDILIKDSKIVEIGENIQIDNVEIIDATNKNVYPGLIDAHSHIGIMESSIGYEGLDLNEGSNPITPELRALDSINPMDEAVSEANEAGVTTVCVPPGSGNVVGGQAVIFKTYGNCIDEMVIDAYVALKGALGENPKRFYKDKMINTRMKSAQLMRKLFLETLDYQKRRSTNPDLPYNMQYEAVLPVINREVDFKVHAHRADDILTAIRIAKEFNLKLTLEHCTEGHLIPELVKASNAPALVGPTMTAKSKFELANRTFKTPGILQKAGVLVAIITDAPFVPQPYLALSAALAIKAGMDEYEALKAITINPAKILHLEDRLGSIKVNKDADIVICDGNIFEASTNVDYTITNGKVTFKRN